MSYFSDAGVCAHNHPNVASQGGARRRLAREEEPSLANEQTVRALIPAGDGFSPSASHSCQRASLSPPTPPLPCFPLLPTLSLSSGQTH